MAIDPFDYYKEYGRSTTFGIPESRVDSGSGGIGSLKQGGVGLAGLLAHPAVGIGATVVSTIANMIGARRAKEQAKKEQRQQEALQRAQWLSGRREQAVGRWG